MHPVHRLPHLPLRPVRPAGGSPSFKYYTPDPPLTCKNTPFTCNGLKSRVVDPTD